jgi:hypothetical protein
LAATFAAACEAAVGGSVVDVVDVVVVAPGEAPSDPEFVLFVGVDVGVVLVGVEAVGVVVGVAEVGAEFFTVVPGGVPVDALEKPGAVVLATVVSVDLGFLSLAAWARSWDRSRDQPHHQRRPSKPRPPRSTSRS